jgi:hypothetical protein
MQPSAFSDGGGGGKHGGQQRWQSKKTLTRLLVEGTGDNFEVHAEESLVVHVAVDRMMQPLINHFGRQVRLMSVRCTCVLCFH